MSVPSVQQSESAMCIPLPHLFWISFPFRSTQSTGRVLCAIQQVFISYLFYTSRCIYAVFHGGLDDKEPACSAGDPDSIPGSGRSPGEGNGNPLQYSCLRNPIDRGTQWATLHGVPKGWRRLCDYHSALPQWVYVSVSVPRFSPPTPFYLVSCPLCLYLCFCFAEWYHLYHFSRFHIYALIYGICFSSVF